MAEKKKTRVLEFYGTECEHCHDMDPIVKKVEKETGIVLEKFEVWHNEENDRIRQKYDRGFCGGVPFFYNESNGKWVCGAVDYETFKKFVLGK